MKFAVVIFSALAIIGLLSLKSYRKVGPALPPTGTPTQNYPSPTPQPPFLLNLKKGEKTSFQVFLNSPGVALSALSFRLSIPYSTSPVISVTDKDAQKSGVQLAVNPALSESGWSIAVNSVASDKNTKVTNIDLAAANLTPEGYTATGELLIATVELTAQSDLTSFQLAFDPVSTELVTKKLDRMKITALPDILYLK